MRITDITNITGITRRFKGGGIAPPPFKSDLTFDFFARDVGSLTLQEKVAGNDAEVVGGDSPIFVENTEVDLGITQLNRGFSYKCIVNELTDGNSAVLVSYDSNTYEAFNLSLSNNGIGRIVLFIGTGTGSTFESFFYDYIFNVGDEFGISISDTGEIKFFINGAKVKTCQTTKNPTSVRFRISGGTYKPLLGSVTNVRFYTRELTELEMSNDSANPLRQLYLNGHSYDSISSKEMTAINMTYGLDSRFSHSTLKALDLGYVELDDGSQVINSYKDNNAFTFYIHDDSDTSNIYNGITAIPAGNVINITSDGVSYNQLRDIISGITDASATNPYKINATGTFNELDLIGKNWIWLNTDNNAIINTDGNWSEITPSDYSFSAYQSTAFNLVPQAYKHGMYLQYNCIVTGFEFISKDTKYNIHQDPPSIGAYHSIVEGCHFDKIETNLLYRFNVGIGARANQFISYRFCTSEYTLLTGTLTDTPYMFFWHNTANQSFISELEIIRCDTIDSNFLVVTEQGSNQADEITINYGTSTKSDAIIDYREKTGVQNLVDFDIKNTDIDFIIIEH